MNEDHVNGNGSVDAGRLRRQMLGEFLRELVREKGRMEAAEMLGVNYRTLVKAEESGELTGRMSDALERLLFLVDGSDEPNQDGQGGQSERLDRLEGKMRALAKEVQDGLEEMRAAVARQGEAQAGAGEAQGTSDDEGAGWSENTAAPRWPAAFVSAGEAAGGPGDRDRGGCRGRHRGLRRGVASGGGVAQPSGRPPEPGEEPVVAGRRGTAVDAGAGDAGGARADAAPGEPAAAGLRAQGADQLAVDGAPGHPAGAGKAQAVAVGAACLHPGAVVEVIGPVVLRGPGK